mgnify:FL=1
MPKKEKGLPIVSRSFVSELLKGFITYDIPASLYRIGHRTLFLSHLFKLFRYFGLFQYQSLDGLINIPETPNPVNLQLIKNPVLPTLKRLFTDWMILGFGVLQLRRNLKNQLLGFSYVEPLSDWFTQNIPSNSIKDLISLINKIPNYRYSKAENGDNKDQPDFLFIPHFPKVNSIEVYCSPLIALLHILKSLENEIIKSEIATMPSYSGRRLFTIKSAPIPRSGPTQIEAQLKAMFEHDEYVAVMRLPPDTEFQEIQASFETHPELISQLELAIANFLGTPSLLSTASPGDPQIALSWIEDFFSSLAYQLNTQLQLEGKPPIEIKPTVEALSIKAPHSIELMKLGLLSPNEIRSYLNLPEIDGGDKHIVFSASIPFDLARGIQPYQAPIEEKEVIEEKEDQEAKEVDDDR